MGLCKTRWVEWHTCFEVFPEMYVVFVTFLDAMLHPHQHPQLGTNDTWDWDRDTLVKTQGMMAALKKHCSVYYYQEHFGHSKGAEVRSRCARGICNDR